ncbi:hypothetical protein PUN28_017029 [Cardiocondyla obscurior]|uniref:Uncharacterized protein n=1 Tax=Cardiocondyla obscurior TaxID=286306 RepID=A0AAW2EJZ0_9HYME
MILNVIKSKSRITAAFRTFAKHSIRNLEVDKPVSAKRLWRYCAAETCRKVTKSLGSRANQSI